MRLAFAFCLSLWGAAQAGPLSSFLPTLAKRATGFQIAPESLVDASSLDPTCKQVLKQTINCDEYVANLGVIEYHGSLSDTELTDAVCASTCRTGLLNAQRRISGACAKTPDLAPGYPVLALIDSVIAGWNETCLKDKETGDYCNDIIDSWEDYEEIDQMPEEQLCSYCFGAKLRMMQQSPYSAYDELFVEMLKHVNEECKVDSPTDPTPAPIQVNGTEPDTCFSGQVYSTKDGDSCDSIALEKSVSAATLYYINPSLLNCSSVPDGLELCLPEACSTTHTVQEGDSCVELGVEAGTSWMHLIDWNIGLDSRCSNLWGTNPFWGRVICVSPPGGEFEDDGSSPGNNTNPGNGNIGGEGGSGDGYSDRIADAPEDGEVAEGTTKKCGHYIQAKDRVGCASMLVSTSAAVPIDLFLQVNPSLGTAAECDDNLVSGLWYCLNPFRYWNGSSTAV
ncbi:hypothetical protein DL770_006100 [Monosporascus sp. CRB-9-2]|nr:hypothetical protein DL770_006100 [Monosporascus sp. CRB-9-2]